MSGTSLMLPPSRRTIVWAAAAVVVLLAIYLFEPFVIVRAGFRGVLLNFGAVQSQSLSPGLHVVTPIVQSIVQIDTRIQLTQTVEDAASKDLQDVHTTVATNWSIDPEAAPQLYQTIGTVEQILDRLIAPAVANTIKAVTARFDAEELITKRDQVADQTLTGLRRYLEPYHVSVAAMNIINFAFSPDFSKAIESKQVAQQRALQAQYELDQKRVSAQERVVEAEAAANAQVAQARGEAQSIVLKAQAQADANTQIAKSLSPDILRWRAVSTWDGKLPSFLGASTPVPFIGMDGKSQ
jgi:regulator of protease activity HflC (stomatin/prohibitin superfamily)